MSFGLNGCSIRFVPRQSIKIAQLTPAPTTFSLERILRDVFLSTLSMKLQVLHTQAVQNTEFCNKNI